jgi:biotin operon repressor
VTLASATAQQLDDHDAEPPLDSGITSVVYERGIRALRSLLEAMSQADLEEAAKEASDPEVILRVLEFSKFQSPVIKARLRAAGMKLKLLELGGGTYTSQEVAELLGVQRQTVNKRVKAKALLAVERGKHGYVYPAWQFVDGDTLVGLPEVLRSLDPSIDPWMTLAFFLNRSSALGGITPLEALRQGDVEEVVRVAKLQGEHGAP